MIAAVLIAAALIAPLVAALIAALEAALIATLVAALIATLVAALIATLVAALIAAALIAVLVAAALVSTLLIAILVVVVMMMFDKQQIGSERLPLTPYKKFIDFLQDAHCMRKRLQQFIKRTRCQRLNRGRRN